MAVAIEARVQAVAEEVAVRHRASHPEVRTLARGWLHGSTATYGNDFMHREQVLALRTAPPPCCSTPPAKRARSTSRSPTSTAPCSLPFDHPVALRIDAAEVLAWRAFVGYVRTLAGE